GGTRHDAWCATWPETWKWVVYGDLPDCSMPSAMAYHGTQGVRSGRHRDATEAPRGDHGVDGDHADSLFTFSRKTRPRCVWVKCPCPPPQPPPTSIPTRPLEDIS